MNMEKKSIEKSCNRCGRPILLRETWSGRWVVLERVSYWRSETRPHVCPESESESDKEEVASRITPEGNEEVLFGNGTTAVFQIDQKGNRVRRLR
jgi:uncharacterized cupin superfamily protein